MLIFLLVLIISISFVSAGWFGNFLDKITGKAIVCNGGLRTDYNVCSSECGASSGCNMRSVGSTYKCNSDGTYNSGGESYCTCNSACQADTEGGTETPQNPTPPTNSSTNDSSSGSTGGTTGSTGSNTGTSATSTSCVDSDGGKTFYIKGITTKGTISVTDYCSGNTLYEHYCTPGGILYQNFNYVCSNGCSNGACIFSTSANGTNTPPANTTNQTVSQPILNTTCTDTDGGMPEGLTTKGTCTDKTGTYYDYSPTLDNYTLVEYYCYGLTYPINSLSCGSSVVSCPSWGYKYSENGRCINPTTNTSTNTSVINITNQICTDTDGGYFNIKGTATKGAISVTDYCGGTEGNTLYEQYCDPNNNLIQNFNYVCENECQDGACIKTCFDTEGKNYYLKGKTTNTESNITVEDYCDANGHTLYENYCENDITFVQDFAFECEDGCEDGACMMWKRNVENLNEKEVCDGCFYEDKCLFYGTRVEKKYCSFSGNLEEQLLDGSNCEGSDECESNTCASGKCVNANLIQEIVMWVENLLGLGQAPVITGGCSNFNNDTNVNLLDFAIFVSYQNSKLGDTNYNAFADYNDDNFIDDSDFACFQENYGKQIKCPDESRFCEEIVEEPEGNSLKANGEVCEEYSECFSGYCVNNVCEQCEEDSECSSGYSCIKGVCEQEQD